MAEQLGRFVTDRVLGTGAFATVWLGYDDRLADWVAIKVLAENWAHDAEIRGRFIEEARILRRVDSANIVPVHEVDELPDGRPYMVMAYADRGTLELKLRQIASQGAKVEVAEALDWSLQIASALDAAHHAGIANRDLKPANIMFRSLSRPDDSGRDERLWVGDFGIAKDLMRGRSLTIASGTPHYMSPEQAEGRADERSDIYAAGVVLYEMLTGSVPYPYDSIPQILRAQLTEGPPPMGLRRGDVPPELDAAVSRALSIDPGGRPQSAEQWMTMLRDAATRDSPEPRTAAGSEPAPDTVVSTDRPLMGEAAGPADGSAHGSSPVTPPADAPRPRSESRARRRSMMTIGLPLLLAVALVAGIAAVVLGGDDPAGAETLVLEPITSVGVDPFSSPIVPGAPGGPAVSAAGTDQALEAIQAVLDQLSPAPGSPSGIDFTGLEIPPPSDGGGLTNVSGAAPGLYGGTNVIDICDRDQLVEFLESNPAEAAAWAGVLGIGVDEIRSFVAGLTDVVLQVDTRVTNHGFDGQSAYPIDSVLQAGTAVLVDEFGVPRVRCFCGNPLDVARPLSASTTEVKGNGWDGFDLAETVIITATEPVSELVLADVSSDALVTREPGSPARTGVLVDETGAPLTVPEPTATPAPSTAPADPTPPATPTPTPRPAPTDITGTGSVTASSVYDSAFATSFAVDGSRASSWFSAGGGSATYTWSGEQSFISSIALLSNAEHEVRDFRTGFGFGSVTVTVLDSGDPVFRETFELTGTPDPDISATVGQQGDTVVLDFVDGEDPTCGGFSELVIMGS